MKEEEDEEREGGRIRRGGKGKSSEEMVSKFCHSLALGPCFNSLLPELQVTLIVR